MGLRNAKLRAVRLLETIAWGFASLAIAGGGALRCGGKYDKQKNNC